MNFHLKTLGCKVNQYETESIKEALVAMGHTADNNQPADCVIINSCTVTAESDRKTRQLLHRIRKDNKNAVIVLTGCMVQAFPEKAKALNDVDIVIGNTDTAKVVQIVLAYKKQRLFDVSPHLLGEKYTGLSISDFSERTRAFLKIEDGCNRYCSYCIIPKARGSVRSKPLEDIKRETESLIKNGYKEIVLVGINLSAYGQGTEYNICDAVDTVCAVEGIKRVRLGSLEPDHITDEMLNRLKNNEKFCPQFHLSLQSGCDKTLKRMNRHYDSEFYYDLILRIRRIFENASITTDVMVGFAGETEDEFNRSVSFVKKVGFARAHIFAYSRRAGTVADLLDNQVKNSEKQRRAKIMADICKESEKQFLLSQIGGVYSVMFEGQKDGFNEGYTPNYTRVKVAYKKCLTGNILPVKITGAKNDYCIGELI